MSSESDTLWHERGGNGPQTVLLLHGLGATGALCIGAANRDPAEFPEPDRFDIVRTPNRHLAFAAGAHACAGMSVARLEAQIGLRAIVQRFPDLQLTDAPVRAGRARFRGFKSLPARVG